MSLGHRQQSTQQQYWQQGSSAWVGRLRGQQLCGLLLHVSSGAGLHGHRQGEQASDPTFLIKHTCSYRNLSP